MEIENRSRHPTPTLGPVVRFARTFARGVPPPRLHVEDQRTGWSSDGTAWAAGAKVRVRVSYGLRYPLDLGGIIVVDFAEEFLAVLAHELRHLHQFATGRFVRMSFEEAEEDADDYARRALARWRTRSAAIGIA